MQELIGKTIEKIFVSEDEGDLSFVCKDGEVVGYTAYGNCCSSTWFDSITGVEALIGQTVLTCESVSVEVAESRNNIEGHYIEEMSDYGYKLTTEKGHVDIVYRNSSNGYYGGSADFNSNINVEGMTQINADWEA